MSDYERIYLQPECCADDYNGRMWCQDANPEECDEGVEWTEYVRADKIEQLQSELAQVKQQSLESIRHHQDSIQAKKEVIELLKQQLAEAREANRWIPVSERLPENNSIFLAYSEWQGLCVRQRGHDNDWYDERGNSTMNYRQQIEPITHWKPITKPE